jgi:uncharacterized protein YndB with AHSA1/START domain
MPDILHRVGIDARPERVFETLTTIAGLRGWWVSQSTGDAGAGGTIDFGFCKMRVLEAVPGKRVRWRCIEGPPEMSRSTSGIERNSGSASGETHSSFANLKAVLER